MNNYLVYGTGKSGVCAASLLKRQGENAILFDENENLDIEKFKADHPEISDVRIVAGALDNDLIHNVGTVVLSPGVPLYNENVKKLKDAGKEIIGEVELGYLYEKGRVAAITGTNGKTTTTSLTGHLLRQYFGEVFVAGNIGDPYTAVADKTNAHSVTVLEVSSFQLETIHTFSPHVSAVLNITPDHLDRHGSFEEYAQIKLSITDNQEMGDICILNYEDDELWDFGYKCDKDVIYFSSLRELKEGLFLRDGAIWFALSGSEEKIIDTSKLKILGRHNHENAMAAIAICLCFDVPMEAIRVGLESFTAVEHRIEYVCEKGGIKYYNDSKGTNPDAAIKAIEAMEWPIVLIAGGYDKHADYTGWIKSFKGRVRHMVLIGESARAIADCATKCGFKEYSFYDTFDAAINAAKSIATKGDCVLLSPACASWGMFKDYEERGRLFKEAVKRD